jgi:5-formyltetrahydrofolate cyclo-ligase
MKAVEIKGLDDLKESSFGVLEPESTLNAVNPKDIDLVLVPGLAFDKRGGRLGYGAGYYDSFLKEVKAEASKVAVAYSYQIIEKVPLEEHDVLIENILTN